MLVAFDKHQNLVNTVTQTISKRQGPFTCPGCRSPLRLKKGRVMRPHFAHVSLEACDFLAEAESVDHLSLKGDLYRWASQAGDREVWLEKHLPAIGQVADLLLEGNIALEVQCSPLSASRLRERTRAYQEAGYYVLWLLGEKLWLRDTIKPLQKDFLYFSQNRGFHLWELDLEKQVLRLKYLIHEDLHGQIQCQEESFAFGEGGLLDVLRQPFVQQPVASFKGLMDEEIVSYVAKQLHFCAPKWMAKQALAYQKGGNLLTQTKDDFYPQIGLIPFTDFAQIGENLLPYYQQFHAYYKKQEDKSVQFLYSPAFYGKIGAMEDLQNGKTKKRN